MREQHRVEGKAVTLFRLAAGYGPGKKRVACRVGHRGVSFSQPNQMVLIPYRRGRLKEKTENRERKIEDRKSSFPGAKHLVAICPPSSVRTSPVF
jgi:hypothetical protein